MVIIRFLVEDIGINPLEKNSITNLSPMIIALQCKEYMIAFYLLMRCEEYNYPVKEHLEDFIKYSENNSECIICKDNIVIDYYTTSCGHRFCNPCLREWFVYSSSCPTCRQPIKDYSGFLNKYKEQ
jgi:hypothetical protein